MAEEFGKKTACGTAQRLRYRLGGEDSRVKQRAPFLKLWPHGQFSLSYRYRTEMCATEEKDEWRFLGGIGYQRPQVERPPNLVSSRKFTQTEHDYGGRASAKYGLKGISRYGMKMVRASAHLLQREHGKENLTFLTLTVPTLSREERIRVAKEWGRLMNRLTQYLTRRLLRAGQRATIVGVTELQSGRAKAYGEAYLHCHFVYPARVAGSRSWAVRADDIRSWWKKSIERTIDRALDDNPRVELKTIRKSAEGYLGKYMTKGSESMAAIVDDLGEDCIPGQQWHISKPMREWVKKDMVNGYEWGDLVQLYLECIVNGTESATGYLKRVEIDIGGRVLTTAWVGVITPEMRDYLGLPGLDR